jgi:hypothetical protein
MLCDQIPRGPPEYTAAFGATFSWLLPELIDWISNEGCAWAPRKSRPPIGSKPPILWCEPLISSDHPSGDYAQPNR